ncbi:hypothetical protein KFE25_008429 [Diacronema lutheri]|uniref:Fe2OG dioxygenase domain-containing protein n=1 Tax=Diacronema lutheri TaxID=2081491 RepID=A0A8J6C1A3_DIALT|nr:hypothetical protein KFE25_008429 [Diacronema lutheri]
MERGRAHVRAFVRELREPALRKWRESGGHVLERAAPGAVLDAYREAHVIALCALALDAQNSALTDRIRERNAGPLRGTGGPGAPRQRPKPAEHDDYSDGSDVQARLVEANVRPGKRELVLGAGAHEHAGSDGRPTRRVVADGCASEEECRLVVAGALLAFAGGFSRNGQSTLGISPALALRLAPATAAEGDARACAAMRCMYLLVERARRRTVAEYGLACELYVSDAQVARLQPVDDAAAARGARHAPGARGHDPWDVGLARGDQFSYWRPHIDQVSVRSYDFSALLYLSAHGADFGGGRLVLHDADAERVVLPRVGRLVLFPSGAESVHAVERVTSGTRFALTMWFTKSARDQQPDPEQRAWLEWARARVDAQPRGDKAPPSPPPRALHGRAPAAAGPPFASRLDGLRLSALCTLPAGDPLCRELLGAVALGSGSVERALAHGVGYDPTAVVDWHALALNPALVAAAAADGAPLPDEGERELPLLRADEWLHPRMEACAALLTALALPSDRAPDGARDGLHAHGRVDETDVASAGAGVASAAVGAHSKKPRAAAVVDAFSVFD